MSRDSSQTTPSPAGASADTAAVDPIAPVRAVLDQVAQVLDAVDDAQYTQNPVGPFQSSVGGHIRHCLDHTAALLQGVAEGYVDYDRRDRGTQVETRRAAALAEVQRQCDALAQLDAACSGQPVTVALMLSGDGPAMHWQSTVGRELAFVLSHTIHHGAMVAAMVEVMGGDVPEGFGLAPSTIAYRAGR